MSCTVSINITYTSEVGSHLFDLMYSMVQVIKQCIVLKVVSFLHASYTLRVPILSVGVFNNCS